MEPNTVLPYQPQKFSGLLRPLAQPSDQSTSQYNYSNSSSPAQSDPHGGTSTVFFPLWQPGKD